MTRHTSSPLRLLAAIAIVIGISAVPIAQVAACSCAAFTSLEEAAQVADVVFAGTVVGEEVGPADPAAPMVAPVRYTFAVDGVAKGEVPAEVAVVAGDSRMCGMTFTMNERWLVFGTVQDGSLTTGMCSGNLPLQPDEEPPVAVRAPTAGDPADGPTAGVPVGVILPIAAVVAIAGVAGLIFWRADRSAAR